jgi:hypothetical protein
MSSRLLHDYPSLASYSEEQLKDLLTNDELLDAFLYSLPAVQGVLEHQQQLSKANDELARKNLALQGELIALRAATASAYSTAQHLKDRWKEVEQKQAGLYSVSPNTFPIHPIKSSPPHHSPPDPTEIPPLLPPPSSPACNVRPRRPHRIHRNELHRIFHERHTRTQ